MAATKIIVRKVNKVPNAAATIVPHTTRPLCHAIPRGTRNATGSGGTSGLTWCNSLSPPPTPPHRILASGGETCAHETKYRV